MVSPEGAAQGGSGPRAALVIPARWRSKRFPGKPLVPLTGAGRASVTLIERTWLAATAARGFAETVVATDDERIATEVERFGGRVAMTPMGCRNGTERCAAVLDALDPATNVVLNWQGDAPLAPPAFAEALLARMADPECAVATPALRCGPAVDERLAADVRAGRVGGTTVVADAQGRALYFSKALLPYRAPGDAPPTWLHVGLYAYRRAALEWYAGRSEGALERQEGLEQLRFLEGGVPIRLVEVEHAADDLWELNNPADVPAIEAALARRGTA